MWEKQSAATAHARLWKFKQTQDLFPAYLNHRSTNRAREPIQSKCLRTEHYWQERETCECLIAEELRGFFASAIWRTEPGTQNRTTRACIIELGVQTDCRHPHSPRLNIPEFRRFLVSEVDVTELIGNFLASCKKIFKLFDYYSTKSVRDHCAAVASTVAWRAQGAEPNQRLKARPMSDCTADQPT